MADKVWINPRDVKPQTAGTLFLIGPGNTEGFGDPAPPIKGSPVYRSVFMRVRVVMGQMNLEDVARISEFARQLLTLGIPFITFAAGRDTPYPEYPSDLEELTRNAERNSKALAKPH